MPKLQKTTLLLDENIPLSIANWLRSERTDLKVVHAIEVKMSGHADEMIFSWAQENQAAILTFDEDFADKRSFAFKNHFGIIRLRIWPITVEDIQRSINRLFKAVAIEDFSGALIIVDNNKIRLRKYPKLV